MRARRYALNSAIRSHPRVQALSWSAFGVAEEAVLVSTTRRGALNSAIRSHPRVQAMSWSAFGVTYGGSGSCLGYHVKATCSTFV